MSTRLVVEAGTRATQSRAYTRVCLRAPRHAIDLNCPTRHETRAAQIGDGFSTFNSELLWVIESLHYRDPHNTVHWQALEGENLSQPPRILCSIAIGPDLTPVCMNLHWQLTSSSLQHVADTQLPAWAQSPQASEPLSDVTVVKNQGRLA